MEVVVQKREQNLWGRIYGYVKRGVEAVYQKATDVFLGIKAFCDSLSEKPKESMAHAKRKLDETCNCVKDLGSKCCETLIARCVEVRGNVEEIVCKLPEAIRRRVKQLENVESEKILGWLLFSERLLKFLGFHQRVSSKARIFNRLVQFALREKYYCSELITLIASFYLQVVKLART